MVLIKWTKCIYILFPFFIFIDCLLILSGLSYSYYFILPFYFSELVFCSHALFPLLSSSFHHAYHITYAYTHIVLYHIPYIVYHIPYIYSYHSTISLSFIFFYVLFIHLYSDYFDRYTQLHQLSIISIPSL